MKQETVTGRAAMLAIPLPPIELKTNRVMGQHWAAVRKAKTDYQWECVSAWSTAGKPTVAQEPVHLRVVVYLGYRQRCDAVDALSWAKAGLDALTGKAWRDDSSTCLNPVTAEGGRDNEKPRLELSW